MKILSFIFLYGQFFFRIDEVMSKLPPTILIIFGNIFKSNTLSLYSLIPSFLFFIINCQQTSVIGRITEKYNEIRDDDFLEIKEDRVFFYFLKIFFLTEEKNNIFSKSC